MEYILAYMKSHHNDSLDSICEALVKQGYTRYIISIGFQAYIDQLEISL